MQSHEAEYAQDLEAFNANTSVDDRAGAHLLVEKTPSCLRKFLAVVSHPLFMSIWTKASKWTRSSTRAAKAYLGKKFSVCLYPAVLEPGVSPCTLGARVLHPHRSSPLNTPCAGAGRSDADSSVAVRITRAGGLCCHPIPISCRMAQHTAERFSVAVYLRLVPFDTSAHVQEGFQQSISEFLRRSGLDPQWVESGETLTILLHQPEQRLNPAPVIQAVCSLEASGAALSLEYISGDRSAPSPLAHVVPKHLGHLPDRKECGRIIS